MKTKQKGNNLDITNGTCVLPFTILYNFQLPVWIMLLFILEDSSLLWEGENSRKNFRTKVITYLQIILMFFVLSVLAYLLTIPWCKQEEAVV